MSPASGPQDDTELYQLERTCAGSLRLTHQHHTVVHRQGGWLLHPTIEQDLKSKNEVQIVDVAAGNGTWTFAIAQQYPDAQVTALDISTALFPPSWTSLPNMEWSTYNLFHDVPDHLSGKFDVVHLRFILASVPEMNVDRLVDKLHAMLKPGGWLQYTETHTHLGTVVDQELQPLPAHSPYPMMVLADAIGNLMTSIRPGIRLDEILRQHGLLDAVKLVAPFKKETLRADTDNMVVSMSEHILAVLKKQGRDNDVALKREVDRAIDKMKADAADGVMFGLMFVVAIGRNG